MRVAPWSAALLGLPLAVLIVVVLAQGGYRHLDERTGRVPRPWWVLAALPATWYLMTALHESPLTLLLLLCWTAVLVVLAGIDLDVHRLPDVIQVPAVVVFVLGAVGVALAEHTRADALRVPLAGLVLGAVYLVLFLLGGGALGLGDVKLAGLLGAVLGLFGWGTLLAGALLGPLIAGLYAVPVLLLRRRGRDEYMPLGPALILGAVLAALPAGL